MNKVDSSNNVLSAVSLSGNPSATSAQLVISSNTLDYGIYAITYTATLTVSSSQTPYASSLSVYVQIVPTGIIVYGLANGVQGMSIGTSQQFSLEPSVNSYDMDSYVSLSSLPFEYYCRPVDSGVTGSYPTYANGSNLDLKTQKTGSYAYSAGCFSSSSN